MVILFFTIPDSKKQHKLEYLYSEHKYLMLHIAYEILKDWHLAEDAVHTSFFKIMKKIDTINDTKCNKTRNLMVIIVRNISIDLFNKRKKCTALHLDDFENIIDTKNTSVEDMVISKNNIAKLAEYITTFDKKYSDVLMLKYIYEYKDNEIASLLGLSSENVRTRLYRGRNLLKNKLIGVNYNEAGIK